MTEASNVGVGEEPTKPNYFGFHKLNPLGQSKAQDIQAVYELLLAKLEYLIGDAKYCREFSIAKTKLEEACFYSKKAMAIHKENQE